MKDLSGLEIYDYFRIFWRRRWYFIIVFVAVSAGGTIYVRQRPDVYRSDAKIAVDVPLSAVSRSAPSVQERKALIREQLSSRSFIERMIAQTGVYDWGASDGFVMERAIRNVQRNIIIQNTSDRTFDISYRATDPMVAQNVTRQFTEELIRLSRRSTTERAMAADRFIESQFLEAERNLREHDEKIREFKAQNAGKLPEQVLANINTATEYRSQLGSIDNALLQANKSKNDLDFQYRTNKEERAQKRLLPSGAKAVILNAVSPEELDLAQKNEELSRYEAGLVQALAKYTENHPDVANARREISRIKQEIEAARAKLPSAAAATAGVDTAPSTVRTTAEIEEARFEKEYAYKNSTLEKEIAELEARRNDLRRLINEYDSRFKTAPLLEQELADLNRERGIFQKEYDTFAAQKATAKLTTAIETNEDNEVYRVIDEANFPIYPETSRLTLILASIAGGFGMGIAAAFGRELIDSTIGSEEEAKKVFNLPVLAAIPMAPKKSKKMELKKTA